MARNKFSQSYRQIVQNGYKIFHYALFQDHFPIIGLQEISNIKMQ